MPLVTQNWYGTQVQGTPYDDAAKYNAASRDATISQLNDRLAQMYQGGNALQMNRDNLNFGVWSTGQNRQAMAAQLQAQRGMQQDRFGFEGGLVDKQHQWATDPNLPSNKVANAQADAFTQMMPLDMQLKQLMVEREKGQIGRQNSAMALPSQVTAESPEEQTLATAAAAQGKSGAEVDAALQNQRLESADMDASDLPAMLAKLGSRNEAETRSAFNPKRWFGDARNPAQEAQTTETQAQLSSRIDQLRTQYKRAGLSEAQIKQRIRAKLGPTAQTLNTDVPTGFLAEDPADKVRQLLQHYGLGG